MHGVKSSPAAGRTAATTARCHDSSGDRSRADPQHGQGGAGWGRLARRGSTTHAVELPHDHGPLAADCAELIRGQIDAVAAPIILAHSGSGLLLPASARALEARPQVWLAAWVPDPEASFAKDLDATPRWP